LQVVTEGNENGFDIIKTVERKSVVENKDWWEGEFVENNNDKVL
jgi:hypothetical protein